MSDPHIRLLAADEVALFRAIRLRAIGEEPMAFLEAYEDLKDKPVDYFRRYFENAWIVGTFLNDELVAIAGLFRHQGARVQHKGTVWGVYAMPKARGLGLAAKMIGMLETFAKNAGIELLTLSANVKSDAAVKLYKRLGYVPCGMEDHILKMPDGSYVDDVWMIKFI